MKIVVSNIPEYYPSLYDGQLYINARAVNQLRDTEIVETNEKLRVKDDDDFKIRKIQSVTYNKYEVEFITTENVDIGIIKIAGKIEITQDNGEIHNAEIINISEPEELSNSNFLQYVLIYRDLDSKDVINHLTYDSTNNPNYILEFQYVSNLYLNPRLTIKSQIYPFFDITKFDVEENTDNKVNIISSESAFKTIRCEFYLDEDTKNSLLGSVNYKNFRDKISGLNSGFNVNYNTINYTALELPEIEVGDALEGIYPVSIVLKYQQILNYPYA